MAIITDLQILNNAATPGDWTTTNFDSPQTNDTNNPTPFYLEGVACQYWWLKKGQTGSTWATTTGITGGLGTRIVVGWMNYPFAEIAAIPITTFQLQVGSSAFATNYVAYNALTQLQQPWNLPISGHTPIMMYPTNPDASGGTFSTTSTTLYYGWSVVTGNTNDGKQGGFDWFLAIGWIGAHSATYTQTYYSSMYNEAYDSNGGGLPGTTSRPLGVLAKSGNNYTSNVSFQMGQAGASLTAIVETGKSIYFSNIQPEQNLGYVFVNGTGDLNVTLTSVVHSWNEQEGTNPQIFTDASNCDTFKITSCSFSNGGGLTLPSDTANRWVRGCSFTNIKAQSISDGEFTGNTIAGSLGMTVSGDADLTGTSILTPSVAADGSGVIWNGNYDPNGNLDDMVFTKGTNAHHALEFGTATPLTMTLTNMDFTGFNASNAQNDSTFYIRRTSGTVTINLVGCTGVFSYKSSGATVVVQSTVVHKLIGMVQNSEVTYTARGTAIDSGTDGSSTTGSRNFVTTNAWTVDAYKGHLLYITTGADAGRYYITGNSATTLYLDAELTATAGSLEYDFYDENDDTVPYHLEDVLANGESSYAYNYAGDSDVDIIVHHVNYEQVVLEDVTLGSDDAIIPIQQTLDINYFNPP